jgi:hypothetical protein
MRWRGTTLTDKPHPIASFLRDEFLKWAARMIFLALAAVLAWVFTPIGTRVAAIWTSPDRLAEMQVTLEGMRQSIDQLNREVIIARAPAEIVEYGPASSFARPCKAGQVCLLTLEIRRTSDAAEQCRILPGTTRREIISAQGGRVWEPEAETGTPRNIGSTFVLTEIRVVMPEGLEPGRYYYRQTTFYEDCPWQHDGKPPVSSVSPLIQLEILE